MYSHGTMAEAAPAPAPAPAPALAAAGTAAGTAPDAAAQPPAAGDDDALLRAWTAFDLDGRRLLWDKQALEMQDSKAASSAARRRLAEMTKDFRKKSDEEKLVEVKGLLKAYQAEIDSLTQRCKASDGAFFAVYKGLSEVPDPVGVPDRLASYRVRGQWNRFISQSWLLRLTSTPRWRPSSVFRLLNLTQLPLNWKLLGCSVSWRSTKASLRP